METVKQEPEASSNKQNTPPSIFTIDHILNKAGNLKQNHSSEQYQQSIDNQSYSDDQSDENASFSIDKLNQYPPILGWLQYTRYKPPRLPSKNYCFKFL